MVVFYFYLVSTLVVVGVDLVVIDALGVIEVVGAVADVIYFMPLVRAL